MKMTPELQYAAAHTLDRIDVLSDELFRLALEMAGAGQPTLSLCACIAALVDQSAETRKALRKPWEKTQND